MIKKRFRKTSIVVLILTLTFSSLTNVSAHIFEAQVTKTSEWSNKALKELFEYKDYEPKYFSHYVMAPLMRGDLTEPMDRELMTKTAILLNTKISKQLPARDESIKPFDDTESEMIFDAQYLGLVNGIGERQFGPKELVTREQAAVFFVRAVEQSGIELESGEDKFVDDSEISSWAKDAVYKARNHKIINGYEDNTFKPSKHISKEEGFILFKKLYELYAQENIDKPFKSLKEAGITLDSLETCEIDTYDTVNSYRLNNYLLDRGILYRKDDKIYYQDLYTGLLKVDYSKSDLEQLTEESNEITDEVIFTIGSYNRTNYRPGIGHEGYSAYNSYEILKSLNEISYFASNKMGENSSGYKDLMNLVINAIEGEEEKTYMSASFIKDGYKTTYQVRTYYDKSLPEGARKANGLAVEVKFRQQYDEKYKKEIYKILPSAESRFTSLEDINFKVEHLNKDVSEYPSELIEKKHGYELYKSKHGFAQLNTYSSEQASVKLDFDIEHTIVLGRYKSNFSEFTNEQVYQDLQMTAAYLKHASRGNDELYNYIVKTIFDNMNRNVDELSEKELNHIITKEESVEKFGEDFKLAIWLAKAGAGYRIVIHIYY